MDKIDYKKVREDRVKSMSKKKLFDVSSKKIRTTMIGALSTVEEHLGFLWAEGSVEAEEFKKIYERIRSEILDRGNNQIRNLEAEFSHYDVMKHQIVLPVINKDQDYDR